MISFKKARIDQDTIKIGNTTIIINNITYKTLKEDKKDINWLMRIFFLMLIIPLIQIKFIGFYLYSLEILTPFFFISCNCSYWPYSTS